LTLDIFKREEKGRGQDVSRKLDRCDQASKRKKKRRFRVRMRGEKSGYKRRDRKRNGERWSLSRLDRGGWKKKVSYSLPLASAERGEKGFATLGGKIKNWGRGEGSLRSRSWSKVTICLRRKKKGPCPTIAGNGEKRRSGRTGKEEGKRSR